MSKVILPQDDAFRNDQLVQWWYWTGHAQSKDGKRKFGFEFAFFAVDIESGFFADFMADKLLGKMSLQDVLGVQMIQCAVTDINQQTFVSRVDYLPLLPKEIPNGFKLHNFDHSVTGEGGGGKDQLRGKVDKYVLDIKLNSLKDPVIHYDGEKHPYDFGGYTYYYSRDTMSVEGSMTVDGEEFEVSGNAWFDRQYGELFPAIFIAGWQWFAIQLDNDMQIMLFDFHKFEKERMGSINYPDGTSKELSYENFEVTDLEYWTSPHTGRKYPSKWMVRVDDMEFILTPQVADQEIAELWAIPKYWEGSCLVEGSSKGKAYVELVGYRNSKETPNEDMPQFVTHGGEQELLQPYTLKRVELQVFTVEASYEQLQILLNTVFNLPSGQAVKYHPLTHKVLLVYSVTQDSAPSSGMGTIPEIDVAFWLVNWAEDPFRITFFMPYVFVNTSYAMISGGEVFGFNKTLGTFEIPSLKEPPDKFTTSTMVFEEGKIDQPAALKEVFRVDRVNSGEGERKETWKNFEDAGKHLVTSLFGGDRIRIPGLGTEINILEHFLNLNINLSFLKQFRDVADGDFACYQAITEAPMRTGTFYRGGLMLGDYRLTLQNYPSQPIATDFGIPGNTAIALGMAFWADFDFTAENGKVIWKA